VFEALGVPEERAARDEHVGSRTDGTGDGRRADAAVHLDVEVEAAGRSPRRELGDLGLHRGEVLLPAESRVDGHHQDEVDEVEHVLDRRDGGVGVDRDRRGRVELTDVAERAVQVRAGLLVDDDDAAAGLDVARQQVVGAFDHQVRLERHGDVGPDRGDDVGTEREVRDEVAVHHVPLDAIYAGLLEGDALVAQPGEVGGQDGRRDGDRSRHHLTLPWRPMSLVELRTTGAAKGGEAVAREPSGRVVFVEGALAGEVVTAELVDERRDFARARVVSVLERAEARVEPPCPAVHAGCGGCDLQHAGVDAQAELKAGIVRDALARLAKLEDVPPIDIVRLPTEGYRTNVRGLVVDGRFALRRRHSHDAVTIDSCLVLHPLLDELVREGRFGDATGVTLRCGVRTGERLAVLTPSVSGVALPADVRVVGEDELASGKRAWIHEEVAGVRLRVSAQSFFQARPDGADALVAAVARATGRLAPGTRVVDAYAGVGLFSATVAVPAGAAVLAVERAASSVADARVNLAGTGARIVRSDVERFRPQPADVVIADPARTGLGRVAARRLAATGAARFVLVSCDPAAFARDAGLLRDAGYTLDRIELVDLFGHTSHIELVSTFSRSRRRPRTGE
jgi:23S rRNA (uracil1939-C5)-methyltransferase